MNAPTATQKRAYSKALMLRDHLRSAAAHNLKPIDQAVLCIIIAESWLHEHHGLWYSMTSVQRLSTRLSVSTRTIKRTLSVLRELNVIRCTVDRRRLRAKYWIAHPEQLPPRAGGARTV